MINNRLSFILKKEKSGLQNQIIKPEKINAPHPCGFKRSTGFLRQWKMPPNLFGRYILVAFSSVKNCLVSI